MGSFNQQAVFLYDALSFEYLQKLIHHTELPIRKDMLVHSQIATQYYKQIERCSKKDSIRKRVNDDNQSYRNIIFSGVVESL